MRILCLFFPRLGIQIVQRERPEFRSQPLVLLQGCGDAAVVTAASAEGLTRGMSAGQARQAAPSARFMADNASDCLDELDRLAAIVRRAATPLVETGGRDHLFVDVDGLADHFSSESNAAFRIASMLQERTNLDVRAAVAATRSAALKAARASRHGVQILDAEVTDCETVFTPADQTMTVSFEFPVAHDSAATDRVLIRQLGRLGDVFEARSRGYRLIELEIATLSGEISAVRLRPATPMYSREDIVRVWNAERPEVRLADVRSVAIRCSGPSLDVRVAPGVVEKRVAVAPRVTRPRQMHLQASA